MTDVLSELRTLAVLLEQAGKSVVRLAEKLEAQAAVPVQAPALPEIHEDPERQELTELQELPELPELEEDEGLRVIDLDAAFAARAPQQGPAPEPELEPEPEPEPEPVEQAEAEPERDWEQIVEVAVGILLEDRERRWEPVDLAREVRERGARVGTLRGLYAALLVRLRQRPEVEERRGKVGARSVRPSEDWPWERIVEAAVKLLEADPERRWRHAELARAVREAGVEVHKLQGMHFGLVARLRALGKVVEEDGLIFHARPHGERSSATAEPAPAARGKVFLRRNGEELKVVRSEPEPAPAPVPEPAVPVAVPAATAAPAPAPAPAESLEPLPSVEEEVNGLWEEVQAGLSYLGVLDRARRTEQVAIWAGRARQLQEHLEDDGAAAAVHGVLHRLFGALTRTTRQEDVEWVDALSRRFATDWSSYVEWHRATLSGHEPELDDEELAQHWRDALAGLTNPDRANAAAVAARMIADAAEVLPPTDAALVDASRRFGDPLGLLRHGPVARKTERPAPPAQEHHVPAEVLETTRGKRILMVGGQGQRAQQRDGIALALGLGELDWVVSERGQASHFDRLAQRVQGGSFDAVFFVSAFSSHKATPFIAACRQAGIPVVYLSRGYGLNRVVEEVRKQWVPRGGPPGPESQVFLAAPSVVR